MELLLAKSRKAPMWMREMLAEMMGTFILCAFGIGSVAQFAWGSAKNDFLSVNFGWGLGCAFGVYWSAGVSGGHINPAVSLAMAVTGRLRLKKLPLYWIAQTLGAFLASLICYGTYYDLLMKNGGTTQLSNSGIWTTYLSPGVSSGNGFGDQVIGTMLLVGTVFALCDKRNNAPAPHLLPFIIGFLVLAIGACFGSNAGYGINPARDLIPRIFTAIAGWGDAPFTSGDYWGLLGVIAQLIGGVLGALLYLLSVEMHHPKYMKEDPVKAGENNNEETMNV